MVCVLLCVSSHNFALCLPQAADVEMPDAESVGKGGKEEVEKKVKRYKSTRACAGAVMLAHVRC